MNRLNLNALVSLNAVAALALATVCFMQISRSRQLNRQNVEIAQYGIRRQAVVALLNESVQYAQKNPAISPILSASGLVPGKPAVLGQPAIPGTRPGTR